MFLGIIPIWNVFCHLYQMRCLLILFALLCFHSFGQNYFKDHFGASAGVVANFGTHNNSIGLTINGYYTDNFCQFNLGSSFLLFENGLGNRKRFIQNRSTIGLVLLAGKDERTLDFEYNGLNHQTTKNLGLGYNYIFYFDTKGTSQTSGGFGFHIKEFALYHENDLFGGNGKDRFRTGVFHASYQYGQIKFNGGIQLWTGESKTAPLYQDSCRKCPSGYRDLRNSAYGRTSHGNAYVGFTMTPGFKQNASFRIGIDSEEIRHTIQNLFIHNLGNVINRPTPHYPKLNNEGLPAFNKSEARPSLLYLQFSSNNGWSY